LKEQPVKKQFRTNKATFEISGDRLVKSYFKTGDAEFEFYQLKLIEKYFVTTQVKGWKYRALKMHELSDDKKIVMEFFRGETLREIFKRKGNPKIYNHMGVWLGFLHKFTVDANIEKVLGFDDYTDTNFLINIESSEIVAIDPGVSADRKRDPSISLVIGFFSIQRGVYKTRKNPFKAWFALYHFMNSYYENNDLLLKLSIKPGIRYLSKRQKVFWYSKKNFPLLKKIFRTTEVGLVYVQMSFFRLLFRAKSK
jgi:tRNA A-37 threonylcarbamoyl transferase component Bud32